ncbi:MAG TPA: cation:proton antiporter [Methylomirabilota bacterium]|nr:cation:proton antiporter [Methylomirabilota bacterium]
MHTETLAYSELMVFLVAAGLVVPIAQRFRVSPVLGFLLIGVLIGPYGLGRLALDYPLLSLATIDDEAGVHTLGEFGVTLLLFVIGLELSVERLWSMRRLVFGFGGSQVLVSAIVIGLIAYSFGNTPVASIVLGSCLALSSTAIVMQLLTETHRLGAPAGRAVFAVLLMQDLAVVPMLVLVEVVAKGEDSSIVAAFGEAGLYAVLAITAIMLLGNLLIRPLFRVVGATRSRELFMATVLLTVLSTGVATAAAGLSMALGAFLAGLLLADTEYRHQVEVDIEPFKGLFLGVFFLSVGMGIDPLAVLDNPLWILGSVVALFVVKGAILFALALLFKLPRPVAAEVALTAGQAGEFAFVIIGLALSLSVVEPGVAQFMLIVAGLSMVATPLMARLARDVAARLEDEPDDGSPVAMDAHAADLSDHVIIAGYGRVGRMLGELLERENVPHIGLDTARGAVARMRADGIAVFYGDASRPEILERVGIARAGAVVLTMDSTEAAERVVAAVRSERPTLPIYARARDTAHALRLLAAGATTVIPETVEASLQLGEAVLQAAGLPEEVARRVVEERRRLEEALLHKN